MKAEELLALEAETSSAGAGLQGLRSDHEYRNLYADAKLQSLKLLLRCRLLLREKKKAETQIPSIDPGGVLENLLETINSIFCDATIENYKPLDENKDSSNISNFSQVKREAVLKDELESRLRLVLKEKADAEIFARRNQDKVESLLDEVSRLKRNNVQNIHQRTPDGAFITTDNVSETQDFSYPDMLEELDKTREEVNYMRAKQEELLKNYNTQSRVLDEFLRIRDSVLQESCLSSSEILELLSHVTDYNKMENKESCNHDEKKRTRLESFDSGNKLCETSEMTLTMPDKELENLRTELSCLREAFEEKNNQLTELNEQLEQAATDACEMTQEVAIQEHGHIQSMKKLADHHELTIKNLLQENKNNVEELVQSHEETLAALETRLGDSSLKCSNMEKSLADAQAYISHLSARVEYLQSELSLTTENHANEIRTMKAERESFRLELEEISEKAEADKRVAVEAAKASMESIIEESKKQYVKEHELRKKLHNDLIDLRGNIRVYCRVRPMLSFELAEGTEMAANVAEYPESNEILLLREQVNPARFEFDGVFQPCSTNKEIFEDIQPFITSVLDGYNVCLFAYGQTGSGKTYTMEGTQKSPGVNYRALDSLFSIRKQRAEVRSYTFSISILEIYNERVHDLLVRMEKRQRKKRNLNLRLNTDGDIFVEGLCTVPVSNVEEVEAVMKLAQSFRAVGAHNLNEHSSRSHLVLTVMVDCLNTLSGAKGSSTLRLIDLAGSERISKTEAAGDRLKEAQAINKSLSALGDVIAALGQQQNSSKAVYIPYRNSKLTHLLQHSLGGNSKVAMFVNVSPIRRNVGESFASLQFAHRCRRLELGPCRRNTESAEIEKYKKIVAELVSQLEDYICEESNT